MENTIIARNYKFENRELTKATETAEAEAELTIEDEIAINFLTAKMALDRLVELFINDPNTTEILTEMKTRLEIIENGGAR